MVAGEPRSTLMDSGEFLSGRPFWQLPAGVSRGTWDYVQSEGIAQDYDAYFADHPLLELDREFVFQNLPDNSDGSAVVADFGCGTGRVARDLMARGYRVLNLDLSLPMLKEAESEIRFTSAASVRVNLAELEALRDQCLDMGVCLFSSLGMIRGRTHRRNFLRHVARSLKPEAPFIVHVHNRNSSWRDPGGLAWLIASAAASLRANYEFGDRSYAYRGLPAMFLHIYSRTELLSDLRYAGFNRIRCRALNHTSDALLCKNRWFDNWRAGGYLAIAQIGSRSSPSTASK